MHDKFVQPSKSFSDIILKGTDLIEKLVIQKMINGESVSSI